MAETQLTFSAKNHDLDNNDNFSPDGKWLCYDTRDTVGEGIGNGQSIEVVELATGQERVLYQPEISVTGSRPAPGVGAVSFSGAANEVAFIHGPPVAELGARGAYDKPNRCGAWIHLDRPGQLRWLDARDIATDRDTTPGAHRGGTHRHEFSWDGARIGFTYDDFLLPQYDRTIGFMLPHPEAPAPASHYFALLVKPAKQGEARAGEIEKAYGDAWIGRQGLMRAFIGKVREKEGGYEESLFVVDVPEDIDITTADAGSATRYPTPPQGLTIRRLTHDWAGGIVRGTPAGDRIAYFAKDAAGRSQVFVIPSDGSDQSEDPAKRPVQLTHLENGTEAGLRWHPSGNSICCLSEGGVAVACAKPGPNFGKTLFLTPHADGQDRIALAMSFDGTMLAYNKAVAASDADGTPQKNYAGEDFRQIFLLPFPDENKDGIADSL